MAYSTVLDVRNACAPGVFTLSGGPPTGVSLTKTAADMTDTQLQDSIAEADATIDTFIGGRYATPVAGGQDGKVPHPIDFLSRDIAAYLATLTYRKNQNLDPTDPIQLRYNAAMSVLIGVRDKGATLPIPVSDGGTGGTSGAGAPINPFIGTMFPPGEFDVEGPSWPQGSQQERNGHWIPWSR